MPYFVIAENYMRMPSFVMTENYMRVPSLDTAENYTLMSRYGLKLYAHAMFCYQ